ncbi:MAG: MFS transporter [Holosporaceae bacterium]|nr:MFS transporter [Holosporaceae bacterium]
MYDFQLVEYFRKGFIGFAYGLSFPLTLVVLDFWLKDAGVSNSVIGVFSIFHWPFILKFIWGVFIENYDIPYLTKKIGKNRSWIVVGYFILIAGVVGMSFSDPKSNLLQLILFASLTALGDGCKDVALYPYQIDGTTKNQLGYVAGAVGFGHKIGMIITKVGALHLAYFFGWRIAYLSAAAAMFFQMIAILFIKTPDERCDANAAESLKLLFSDSISKSLIIPFREMMKENGWSRLISILILYKSADFMMQKMSRSFLLEIGFSKIEIAEVVQLFGSISVIIGGFVSGYIIKKIGMSRAMFYFGITHAISFFSYTILLKRGAVLPELCLIILCEAFTGGCVTTVFLAIFYAACKTGSMYALLWAIHEVSGIFFMGISGIIVDCVGWNNYFWLIPLTYMIIIMHLRKCKNV